MFPVNYRRGRTAHLDVTGARHDAIAHALEEQLGVIPVAINPFNLEGSGGSTPLRITVKGDPETYLFAKLYSATHLRSDRWYKLGRTLLYGQLEDEKAFNTVRRLVQYEDHLLRLMRDADLPVPPPYGVVEITPEREYLLVTEFLDGAHEIGEVDVDHDLIDQGLGIIRRLWEAGLAHRDIKPANLMVRNGRLYLIDTAFGELRPSPWRQAVDLGNMMLVLALRTSPERVYTRARHQFSVAEITEAFAATRGLTMPSQLRQMMRQQGRDLHAEFVALLPEPPHPIRIQRWTMRRVGLIVGLLIAAVPLTVIVPCTPSNHELDKSLVLMAQSVPTASAVPCMRTTLDDWFLDDLDSSHGRTRIEFCRLIDDLALALTIMLTRTCEPARPARPRPTSGERDGSTSASGPGRRTATGGSTCCLVPA